jgi:hypothetical protein
VTTSTAAPGAFRRRWRFRLGTLLALPAIVALALVWSGLGRKVDPDRSALAWELEWAGSPIDTFRIPDRHEDFCLLKVSYFHERSSLGSQLHHSRFAVDGAGELSGMSLNDFSAGGGSQTMPPGTVPAVRAILASLPAAARDVAPADAVVVGFAGPRGWETRLYDKTKLPPRVTKLLGAAGIIVR